MDRVLDLARLLARSGPGRGALRPPEPISARPFPIWPLGASRTGQIFPAGARLLIAAGVLAQVLAHDLAAPDDDPWNGKAGDLTWSVAHAVISHLVNGKTHSRRNITQRVVNDLDANPSTIRSVIRALALFGVIDRAGGKTITLTTLGARWWNNR